MVKEALNDGAGDSGKEELRSRGEVIEFGDFGSFHFAEAKGLVGEFAKIFAGGPSDFAGSLVYLVRDLVHIIIIAYRGEDDIMEV